MTLQELARQVRETRQAQKTYFRTRTSEALETSKRLELALDQVVEEILEAPSLFKE